MHYTAVVDRVVFSRPYVQDDRFGSLPPEGGADCKVVYFGSVQEIRHKAPMRISISHVPEPGGEAD